MKRQIIIVLSVILVAAACRERYDPGIVSPITGYLVVEGFINSGTSGTTIKLSRSRKLSDKGAWAAEANARVYVESDRNDVYTLSNTGGGNYSIASLSLNPALKYRIKIRAANGSEYVSTYSSVQSTPDIDSISWKRENGGVQLYLHSHNDANNTRFYNWRYQETWEFHSYYGTQLKYIYAPGTTTPLSVDYIFSDGSGDPAIFTCWQSFKSANIFLASTEKLSKDVLFTPLTFVEEGSIKMSELYSIMVDQFALSAEAYRFYLQIKKNTEQLGSVFDPQPSEVKGNITCTNNPAEPVIGFVEVSEQKSKRIFIPRQWFYPRFCQNIEIDNNKDSIAKYGGGLMPTTVAVLAPSGAIVKFNAAPAPCVDCTILGTNKRPSFWPQ